MKPKTAAAIFAIPAIAALAIAPATDANAQAVHNSGVQTSAFTDPCHPGTSGTLELSFAQVQLSPDNQFRQIENGDFTFVPDGPGLAAAGHFVDQQTFITSDTPGSATLTESIHAVARYADGTQNPVQLTTVTTFVDFSVTAIQIVKTVCGS